MNLSTYYVRAMSDAAGSPLQKDWRRYRCSGPVSRKFGSEIDLEGCSKGRFHWPYRLVREYISTKSLLSSYEIKVFLLKEAGFSETAWVGLHVFCIERSWNGVEEIISQVEN